MRIQKIFHENISVIISSLLYLGGILTLLYLVLRINSGSLSYALDESYISMAIAKNFSEHGVWCLSQLGTVSCTSSMLWPLILSIAYKLFGTGIYMPLILNIIFGILVLYISRKALYSHIHEDWLLTLCLILITASVPLFAVTYTGTEHILHSLIMLIFVYYSARRISVNDFTLRKTSLLCIFAFTAATVRYESLLFILAVCAVVFFYNKRYLISILLGLVSLIPAVIYGIISVNAGNLFLPNSIIMKYAPVITSRDTFFSSLQTEFSGMYLFYVVQVAAVLIFTAIGLIFAYRRISPFLKIYSVIFICGTILHLIFAKLGGFFRYEAYIILLFLIWFFMYSAETAKYFKPSRMPVKAIWSLLSLMIVSGLTARALYSANKIVPAVNSIYEQQVQVAKFIKKYYTGGSIVTNETGAVSFYADVKTIDTSGASGKEIARHIISGTMNEEVLDRISRQNKSSIAVFNNQPQHVPKSWIKIGQWKIKMKKTGGGDTTEFYAVDPAEKERLTRAFNEYSSNGLGRDKIHSSAE